MENARYSRQTALPEVGTEGQLKLNQSKVLIIGVGGLGSAVLPYLVAAGIGEIGIIDEDNIDISNLQRQVIYTTNSVGQSKVFAAKQMAQALNPTIKINAIEQKLNSENAISLFEQYDIIVDATDNLQTKYVIDDACLVTSKPFVYGSVYRFEGQISVFNFQNGPSYRSLFPNETNQSNTCNETGILGVSVGIIGMFQANEVLKIVLGIGKVLSGKLLIYNFLNNEQQQFDFSQTKKTIMDQDCFDSKYATYKNTEIKSEDAVKQINNPNIIFLDVRNFDEYPKIDFINSIQIPLNSLEQSLNQLDSDKQFFVFCKSGIRSKIAVDLLKKNNFVNVQSIIGGATLLDSIFCKIPSGL